MLKTLQERELEKVNAFYLQKEAEVGNQFLISQLWLLTCLAQNTTQDSP